MGDPVVKRSALCRQHFKLVVGLHLDAQVLAQHVQVQSGRLLAVVDALELPEHAVRPVPVLASDLHTRPQVLSGQAVGVHCRSPLVVTCTEDGESTHRRASGMSLILPRPRRQDREVDDAACGDPPRPRPTGHPAIQA